MSVCTKTYHPHVPRLAPFLSPKVSSRATNRAATATILLHLVAFRRLPARRPTNQRPVSGRTTKMDSMLLNPKRVARQRFSCPLSLPHASSLRTLSTAIRPLPFLFAACALRLQASYRLSVHLLSAYCRATTLLDPAVVGATNVGTFVDAPAFSTPAQPPSSLHAVPNCYV